MKPEDAAAVTRVLSDYYQAFSTLDVHAIVPYFHLPSLMVSPLGVAAIPTAAALEQVFGPAMESLRARDYGRSELTEPHLKQLSATAALASGVAVRYKTDGHELERVGVTYLLHKAGSQWQIAVVTIHDPVSF